METKINQEKKPRVEISEATLWGKTYKICKINQEDEEQKEVRCVSSWIDRDTNEEVHPVKFMKWESPWKVELQELNRQ